MLCRSRSRRSPDSAQPCAPPELITMLLISRYGTMELLLSNRQEKGESCALSDTTVSLQAATVATATWRSPCFARPSCAPAESCESKHNKTLRGRKSATDHYGCGGGWPELQVKDLKALCLPEQRERAFWVPLQVGDASLGMLLHAC